MSDSDETTILATVRLLDGEEALVEVASEGCGRCHEKGGCGGQQITQMFCSGSKYYRVLNPHGAHIDDQVTIAVAPGTVRRTANLAYGVPLTATIVGAAIGAQIAADPGSIIGALLGIGFSIPYVRYRANLMGGNLTTRPYIISRS